MDAGISTSGHLRIGELSRRAGVSVELLRARERRYGLLAPSRTSGWFRLYGDADERRVRRMLSHVDAGLSAGEAARLALDEPETIGIAEAGGEARLHRCSAALREALDGFDEQSANEAFDQTLAEFTLDTVVRDLVLPYLHELGERWARGKASVAQEHFGSALLRGRLLGLARGWGGGIGPVALLACVPGEQHDLGLICFGLALRSRGWRITYLGRGHADAEPDRDRDAAAARDRRHQRRHGPDHRRGTSGARHAGELAPPRARRDGRERSRRRIGRGAVPRRRSRRGRSARRFGRLSS